MGPYYIVQVNEGDGEIQYVNGRVSGFCQDGLSAAKKYKTLRGAISALRSLPEHLVDGAKIVQIDRAPGYWRILGELADV